MYAILGILDIQPSSGYDIKKYSDQVLSGFWHENFGHIYPTLKKMLAEGLIEITDQEAKGRKVEYQITEKGREALDIWLMEETEQQPVRSEFMLKLLFSNHQPTDHLVGMLEGYKQDYQAKLEMYRKIQDQLEKGISEIATDRVIFFNAVLRRGILSSEAVIQWCDETIEELKTKD